MCAPGYGAISICCNDVELGLRDLWDTVELALISYFIMELGQRRRGNREKEDKTSEGGVMTRVPMRGGGGCGRVAMHS
jgi:hypothetical protein